MSSATTIDLRKFVPGLPPAITKEYLDGLTPEGHANLLRVMETGARALRDEQVRTEATIEQRRAEVARITEEVKQDFGAASLEELEQMKTAASADCIRLWADVAQLLDAQEVPAPAAQAA